VGNLSESQAAQIKKRLEAAGGAATVGGGIKIEKDFMLQIFFPGDNAAEFLMDTMKLQLKDVRGNFKDGDETDGTFDPAVSRRRAHESCATARFREIAQPFLLQRG
jgi:hypothetical protein